MENYSKIGFWIAKFFFAIFLDYGREWRFSADGKFIEGEYCTRKRKANILTEIEGCLYFTTLRNSRKRRATGKSLNIMYTKDGLL